jgi:signal peptidase I
MKLFDSWTEARSFLRLLLTTFAVALSIVFFPMQAFQVSGQSMLPRLVDGERILVDELTPRISSLERGDIVVFRHPRDPRRFLVKRVIGLAGEIVEIRRGRVFVNGVGLEERYLPQDGLDGSEHPPIRLGESDYFVLGDHRDDSEDSRTWGPLGGSQIVGRAFLSYWPPTTAGWLR